MSRKVKANNAPIVYKARRQTELKDDGNGVLVFVRYMPQGLVLVRSYLSEGGAAVEMVRNGYIWWRWYDYAPVSTRQAALLVNRFMRDMTDPASIDTE